MAEEFESAKGKLFRKKKKPATPIYDIVRKEVKKKPKEKESK